MWGGKAAAQLGLAGRVDQKAFEYLCDNIDPVTRAQLNPRANTYRRVGYDMNFHAPKSVSVLHALTDDQNILSVFRQAVAETMREMETEMKTRIRRDYRNEDRITGNFLYAEFIHTTARPVDGIPDPHLHAHCFTFNTTYDPIEERFKAARDSGCVRLVPRIEKEFSQSRQLLSQLASDTLAPDNSAFDEIEKIFFEMGPYIAACPQRLPEYIQLQTRLRKLVKEQSQNWDMNSASARDRMYRLLYGSRAALEEVMLQVPADSLPALTFNYDEPSQTPSTKILGVTIHSGDILVSRGGAPTSALIARGNDYPGNFSHVALAHVDEKTSLASIVEAHIERGVAISTLEEYLRDKKLRVMILRPRADLPALMANQTLPHQAAAYALQQARDRHIPYDFEMNYHDPAKLFCSEVASFAYRKFGVNLWMGISHISSPGVTAWLAAFRVKHFETQEPADLEYDPQLRVLSEWRDPETFYQDHVDNAVIDAMLVGPEQVEPFGYAWYLLPMARVMKGYSTMRNAFGGIGSVPEGMNATAALRHTEFNKTHFKIKERVLQMAATFQQKHGYRPPYWELVRMAQEVKQKFHAD